MTFRTIFFCVDPVVELRVPLTMTQFVAECWVISIHSIKCIVGEGHWNWEFHAKAWSNRVAADGWVIMTQDASRSREHFSTRENPLNFYSSRFPASANTYMPIFYLASILFTDWHTCSPTNNTVMRCFHLIDAILAWCTRCSQLRFIFTAAAEIRGLCIYDTTFTYILYTYIYQ